MKISLCLLIIFLNLSGVRSQVPSFPEAEGAGAYASGWRNGSLYIVTNLNTSGPGSFFDAVSAPNRIIIFNVSGTIDLTNGNKGGNYKLVQPNLMIAGQSAPGEGICFIGGGIRILRSNIAIRHLRFRRGFVADGDKGDCVAADPDSATSNIIFDHLSSSWGTDENLTLTKPNKTTAQYCIASEGLDYTNVLQTPPNHSEGSLWGTMQPNGQVSMHHMLYAHNRLRNPRTTAFDNTDPAIAPINDFRNSIVYNCSEYTSHTGSELVKLNWINNYYKDGSSTPASISQILFTVMNDPQDKLYLSGNYVYGSSAKTNNNWLAVNYENNIIESDVNTASPFSAAPVVTQSAEEAYETTLEDGGAILPSRDQIDLRIINDVKNGTGKVINKETDLAVNESWQTYYQLPAPADADNDGMPDFWEEQHGLNTSSSSDNMIDNDSDVYINIEEYLNNTDPTGGNKAIVYVAAFDNRSHETGLETGSFRIFRNNDHLTSDLNVKYTVSGTATQSLDYETLSGNITIPAGKKSAYITVTPLADNITENEETIILNILADPSYNIGLPAQSLVILRDDNMILSTKQNNNAREIRSEVYPNPAGNSIKICFDNEKGERSKVYITDISGKSILTKSFSEFKGRQEILLDTKSWSEGSYFYIIETGSCKLTGKFEIIK